MHKKTSGLSAGVLLSLLLIFAVSAAAGPAKNNKDQAKTNAFLGLLKIKSSLSSVMNRMDSDLSAAAKKISAAGLRGAETGKILLALYAGHPYAEDCATVNLDGKMVTVEPEECQKFEGADISQQEQVVRLKRTGKPVLSSVFTAVEGFEAVDLEYPVFSPAAALTGSVSLLVRPEKLLSEIITPFLRESYLDVWLMEPNGRIIFDPDKEEIGRNLFRDPAYQASPGLLSFGKKIAAQKSGMGIYEYYDNVSGKKAFKEAYWDTVGLYGTEWRLVVTRSIP